MPGITLQEVGGELVIDVPDEATVIGRGQFLQVSDKRVSRSHALLEVSDGKLYLTPTHTNPCFLRTVKQREAKVLTRDVKQLLDHGDEFGLLPDQFFYKVAYPQVNGKEREEEEKEEIKPKEEKADGLQEEKVANGDSIKKTKQKPAGKEKDAEEEWEEVSKEASKLTETKKEEKTDNGEEDQKAETSPEKSGPRMHGDMAMPLNKKRVLPDWMVKVAGSPVKAKTPTKKPISTAVSKRPAGTKLTKPKYNDDEEEEDFVDDDDEEEYVPQKKSRRKVAKDSDDDFDDEPSDDDYVPEKTSRRRGGGGRRKRKASESEDDFSEDDDDYSPKKSKPKPKKTPKGKGGAKGKKAPARTPRKTPQRSRAKYKESDDEDEEVSLPRRRVFDDDDDDDDSPTRRPQRAARQKRGSYVDDPMIEEALEDFASDDDEDQNEDKDSDFQVEGEDDSGSDWEKTTSSSQKQKVFKVSKNKGPPRGPSKRGAVGKGRKKGRRPSRVRDDSEDEDEDIMEDDEPYVPRPSKRRGGAVSRESEESGDDKKKKRRRERCQYGKKCYRKNPVHFRTFCHPGDSSYDEEEKDGSSPKQSSKKEKDMSRTSPEKPTRPQRSTAGTRLVTHGVDDDDDLPDTYDYNDSFIDDGTQRSEESVGDDSDYDAEEDVRELTKDAKKFLKNKKLAKPLGSD